MIVFLYDENDSNQVWFNCFYLGMCAIKNVFINKNLSSDIIKISNFHNNNNDLIVLFSPWFSYCDNNEKDRFILINTESLNVKRNFKLINYFHKNNVLLWFDYNIKNTKLISNYQNYKIYHLPISYSETFENIFDNSEVNKSIDVLFYGYLNERRLSIAEGLKKYNLNVVFTTFSSNNELLHHIKHSKIILIIHYYEECFSINHYRINFLLANKIFIIHEDIEKEENINNYKSNIIFSKYENIVKTCLKYLNLDQSDRDLICNNVYEWYKTEENIEKYIPIDEIKKII